MLKRIREKLNGNFEKIVEVLIIGGMLFWMFCQVRDVPATYLTKAEYKQDKVNLEETLNTRFDKTDRKIDELHFFLMGKR